MTGPVLVPQALNPVDTILIVVKAKRFEIVCSHACILFQILS
jgi:hypothetical protein